MDGRRLTLLLVKNECSLDETIELLAGTDESLDLLLLLHAEDGEFRNSSWLWAADVERLAPRVARATCGGSDAAMAALRLDHAGVPTDVIESVPRIDAALARANERAGGRDIVAVANYWGMLDLRETLAEQGHAERYWR